MRLLAPMIAVVFTSACSLLLDESAGGDQLATDGAVPADDSTVIDAAKPSDSAPDTVSDAGLDAGLDAQNDANPSVTFDFHVNCSTVQCTCSVLDGGVQLVTKAGPVGGGGQASCKVAVPASSSVTLAAGGCPGAVGWTGDSDCTVGTTCNLVVSLGQPGVSATCD